jgi:hypothetical protein
MTTVAILIALGCGPEKASPPMVVAAGETFSDSGVARCH